jgi:hypothetical protein
MGLGYHGSSVHEHVEGTDLATLVDARANRTVLAYLAKSALSCHSDLGEVLLEVAKRRCGEWTAYSPSFAEYRYLALVTNQRIFSLGIGMSSACFCVPAMKAIALDTGCLAAPEIGRGWVRAEMFQSDRPKPDLDFWMLKAYVAAREAGASRAPR